MALETVKDAEFFFSAAVRPDVGQEIDRSLLTALGLQQNPASKAAACVTSSLEIVGFIIYRS